MSVAAPLCDDIIAVSDTSVHAIDDLTWCKIIIEEVQRWTVFALAGPWPLMCVFLE